jgi:hypothetical protein
MEMACRFSLGIIGSLSLLIGTARLVDAAPDAASTQAYSIDQSRYFATPEIERAELKSALLKTSEFPPVAPENPKGLLGYLQGAEVLLSQLQRHRAYLRLRASRDMEERAAADAGDQTDAASHQDVRHGQT